jgi:hypothetical protein
MLGHVSAARGTRVAQANSFFHVMHRLSVDAF